MNEGTSFTHQLGDQATIACSGESGQIIGRAEYLNTEASYLLRYKTAEGRATEQWWPQSALATPAA